MYRRLIAGEFGNTIPQFTHWRPWIHSEEFQRYDWWGVRSMIPGGPCWLNVHYYDVMDHVAELTRKGIGYNISIMIDRIATVRLWAEIAYDASGSLIVYGVENPATLPAGSSWRSVMPYGGRHWEGSAARMILRRHLNASSLDDLDVLLAKYPDHVVELSACEECIGTIPHRNAVVWEVRKY